MTLREIYINENNTIFIRMPYKENDVSIGSFMKKRGKFVLLTDDYPEFDSKDNLIDECIFRYEDKIKGKK